jgi:GntR family transcriptional repressor for pyruvate dehydrogenase complex
MDNFNFLFVDTASSVREIYEVRQALEVQAAISAALRRTAGDLVEIEEAWLRCGHYIKNQYNISTATLHFHSTIVKAAHNDALSRIFDFIYTIRFFSSSTNNINSPERIPIAHEEHRAIMESISSRDADRAGSLMRRHLDLSRVAVIKAISEGNAEVNV